MLNNWSDRRTGGQAGCPRMSNLEEEEEEDENEEGCRRRREGEEVSMVGILYVRNMAPFM